MPDETPPLNLTLRLDAEQADDAELDRLAGDLRQEIEESGLAQPVAPSEWPAPDGAKAAGVQPIGELALSLVPSALSALATLLAGWAERSGPRRALKIVYKTADGQDVTIEYDPDKTSAAELRGLLETLKGGPAGSGLGFDVGGDANIGRDVVGRDKIDSRTTHIHAEPGSTVIVHKPSDPDPS